MLAPISDIGFLCRGLIDIRARRWGTVGRVSLEPLLCRCPRHQRHSKKEGSSGLEGAGVFPSCGFELHQLPHDAMMGKQRAELKEKGRELIARVLESPTIVDKRGIG